MNKYSKISSNRSRSTTSPDLYPFPQTPRKSISSNPITTNPQTHEPDLKNTEPESKPSGGGGEDNNGRRFGEVLSRARSVSSSSSMRTSTAQGSVQCAVKRVISMRRSSSVSEGYSRIHDQTVTRASSTATGDGEEDEEGVEEIARSGKMNKDKDKRGKILKVCKLLFGL